MGFNRPNIRKRNHSKGFHLYFRPANQNISNIECCLIKQTSILMKNINVYFYLFLISLTATSCEAIKDIFKAGVWVGVVGVILVIGLVLFIFGKMRG